MTITVLSLALFLSTYLHPIAPVPIEPPKPVQVSRSYEPEVMKFEITAYCLKGKTASGTTVTRGRTIAADWRILPKGTQVAIEGLEGTFVVEDTGSDIKNMRIDVYMPLYRDCMNFGRRKLFVKILN